MSKNGNTYFDRSVIEPDGETEGRTDMSQNPRQSKSIRAQLLTAMQVGEYAHCDRLPRESVLSEMLGISRQLAYDLINDGELQAIKIGNSFKIPKVSVINFVTEEKKEVKTSA